MIEVNGKIIKTGVFPNKETYADLDNNIVSSIDRSDEVNVLMKFQDNNDLMNLRFIKDYIDGAIGNTVKINLVMPYIPYSRMDRKENDRIFTLKSVADFINGMNFNSVEVWEPHSDVSVALLNRVRVVNKSRMIALNSIMEELGLTGSAWLCDTVHGVGDEFCLNGLFRKADEAGIWLIYPDAGAEKRYTKQIKYPNYLSCSKERDFDTGRIKRLNLNIPEGINKETFKTAIIVDDLCSKGGTFLKTAEELRKAGFSRVVLVVTHCEDIAFEYELFKCGLIDKVVTTDSIQTKVRNDSCKDFGTCTLQVIKNSNWG